MRDRIANKLAIPALAVGITVCVAAGVTEAVVVRAWRKLWTVAR